MATMTKEDAAVTICKGEWDYFAGIYELPELTEEAALAVALQAIDAQLETVADIHCVWLDVPGEYADRKWTCRFDRDELRGE